jgi:hypothetical protein
MTVLKDIQKYELVRFYKSYVLGLRKTSEAK